VLGVLELQFGLTLAWLGPGAIDNANVEIQGVAWKEIAAKSSEAGLIDYLAKSWGVAESFVAVTIIVIAAVPFRKGERWSWYFLWLVPATALVIVIRNLMAGVRSVVLNDLVDAVLYVAALLIPYRQFFPKAQST
jgi:hypothetical protein